MTEPRSYLYILSFLKVQTASQDSFLSRFMAKSGYGIVWVLV